MNTTTTRGRHREPTTRPAWLWPALVALVVFVLLTVLAACSGETAELESAAETESEPTPTEEVEPVVEEEPEPDEDWMSGDAHLDALYVACDEGEMGACDDLYWESPVGSDHEAFGDTCGGRQAEDTGLDCGDGEASNDWSDAEIFELAMDLQLGTLTAAETVELCDGVDMFGMDVAVAAYRVGFEEEGDWLPEYDAILSDAIEELC